MAEFSVITGACVALHTAFFFFNTDAIFIIFSYLEHSIFKRAGWTVEISRLAKHVHQKWIYIASQRCHILTSSQVISNGIVLNAQTWIINDWRYTLYWYCRNVSQCTCAVSVTRALSWMSRFAEKRWSLELNLFYVTPAETALSCYCFSILTVMV